MQHVASIEEIGFDLSGRTQNGTDQDKACLHRMSLEAEATKIWHDLVHGPSDAGKVGDQVERPFQPRVVGVGLIRSERFVGVIVNLEKVAFRSFRKGALSGGVRCGGAASGACRASR
jgi:hypothetical protein